MNYTRSSFSISLRAEREQKHVRCGIDYRHIPSGPDSRRVCLRCGRRMESSEPIEQNVAPSTITRLSRQYKRTLNTDTRA